MALRARIDLLGSLSFFLSATYRRVEGIDITSCQVAAL